jgi:hypothetical protein
MSEGIGPKKIKLLLEEIYKEYPVLKTHHDYKFFYLYKNKKSVNESLFCVVHDYLRNSNLAYRLNLTMEDYRVFFNLTECSVISENEFLQRQTTFDKLLEESRKTEYTFLLYEVW